MGKILLPSLKKDQNTGLAEKEGGWHSLKSADLIDGIDITLNAQTGFTTFSIPDIYSHFVRFRSDLLETKNDDAYKINAIRDWKQIINIIALNKSRNLGITIKKISPDAKERLMMVAVFMKPDNNYNLLTQFGWKDIYVLLNEKGLPFALLSPTTLFCPAARFKAYIPANSPAELASLSAHEKTELKCWLEHLWYAAGNFESDNNKCKGAVLDMIKAYLQEVSGKMYPQVCPVPESILMCGEEKSPPVKTIIDFLKCYVFMGVVIDETPFDKQNIFTRKLTVFTGPGGIFPGCTGNRPGDGCFKIEGTNNEFALLPFSYEFTKAINGRADNSLDFQTKLKQFISEGTTFEKDSGKYIVKINTQLIGGSIVYEYVYEYADVVKLDNQKVPNVLVWPNAVVTDALGNNCWKCYYIYLEDKTDSSIKIYPLSDCVENKRLDSNDEYMWRISRTDKIPRFLLVSDSDNTDAGVLAVKEGKKITKGEEQAYIGVDFGTTNTNAYIKAGDYTEPLKYEENMFLSITKYEEIMTTANFLPLKRGESIVQTIYQEFLFNESTYKNRSIDKQPITEGHIFFPPTKKSTITEEGNFKTNLKWGDIEAQRAARTFLQQIGLLGIFRALQHNAGKIDFIVSYPSSFDTDRRNNLEANWVETISYLRKLITRVNINESVTMLTESYAVGIFFSSDRELAINQTNGYICIDIGGGTSDISIWQGLGATSPIEQLSLELAGQTILTDNIFESGVNVFETFFKKWMLEEKEKKEYNSKGVSLAYDFASNLNKRNKDLSFSRSLLERIMSLYGDEIVYTDANLVPEVKALRRKLMFYLASIFYSTAILLRKAMNQGTFKMQDSIDFLVAGNGSKTLKLAYMAGNYNWLSNRTNSVYISLYGMIAEIINVEMNKIKIRYSQRPKEEVACGLVESFNFIQINKDYDRQSAEVSDAGSIAGEFIDLYAKHFENDFTSLFTSKESAKMALSAKIKQVNGHKRYAEKSEIEKFAIAVKEFSFKELVSDALKR